MNFMPKNLGLVIKYVVYYVRSWMVNYSNPESCVIHHEVRWADSVLGIAHEFVIIKGATGHNLSKNLKKW